jgi:hypothetical protein
LFSGCCAVSVEPAVWRGSAASGSRVLRLEALLHHPGPEPARRAELGDLLEEVVVDVEEERQPRRERVDLEAGALARLDVRDPVRQGEGDLLRRRRARLADVVPADADRIPARHSLAQNAKTSVTSRSDARGGYT